MKTLRLCLLLLLAALIPVRGAVAAAMLCPAGGHPGQPALQAPAGHDMAHAHHRHDDPQPGTPTAKCTLCAACCALTPLLRALPTLAEPPGVAAVGFADHAAPAPEFFSDGPERPPRPF